MFVDTLALSLCSKNPVSIIIGIKMTNDSISVMIMWPWVNSSGALGPNTSEKSISERHVSQRELAGIYNIHTYKITLHKKSCPMSCTRLNKTYMLQTIKEKESTRILE